MIRTFQRCVGLETHFNGRLHWQFKSSTDFADCADFNKRSIHAKELVDVDCLQTFVGTVNAEPALIFFLRKSAKSVDAFCGIQPRTK